MGEPSPVTTSGTALLATLAGGATNYVLISGSAGSGGATLAIAKAGDVVAYPVTVLVSGRGTVEAAGVVSVRSRAAGDQGQMKIEELISRLDAEKDA